MKDTKIEWVDNTQNIWWGCAKEHTGCKNCYAEALSGRFNSGAKNLWGEKAVRKEIKDWRESLINLNAQAKKQNIVTSVFVGSMMDIFEDAKPVVNHKYEPMDYSTEKLRLEFLELAHELPNLFFMLLTKRPENISRYTRWLEKSDNMILGTSVSDQRTMNEYVKRLIENVPNFLKKDGRLFLSMEPLVGPISLTGIGFYSAHILLDEGIGWVICGGESGPNKRPFNIAWAEHLAENFTMSDVAFFMKQIDKVQPVPDRLMIRQFGRYQQDYYRSIMNYA